MENLLLALSSYIPIAMPGLTLYILAKNYQLLPTRSFWTEQTAGGDALTNRNYFVLGFALVMIAVFLVCNSRALDTAASNHGAPRIIESPVLALFAPHALFEEMRPSSKELFIRITRTSVILLSLSALFVIAASLVKIFSPGRADHLTNYGLAAIAALFIMNFLVGWSILGISELVRSRARNFRLNRETMKTVPIPTQEGGVIVFGDMFHAKSRFADKGELFQYICNNWPTQESGDRVIYFADDILIMVGDREFPCTVRTQAQFLSSDNEQGLVINLKDGRALGRCDSINKTDSGFECKLCDGQEYAIPFSELTRPPTTHLSRETLVSSTAERDRYNSKAKDITPSQ